MEAPAGRAKPDGSEPTSWSSGAPGTTATSGAATVTDDWPVFVTVRVTVTSDPWGMTGSTDTADASAPGVRIVTAGDVAGAAVTVSPEFVSYPVGVVVSVTAPEVDPV